MMPFAKADSAFERTVSVQVRFRVVLEMGRRASALHDGTIMKESDGERIPRTYEYTSLSG